jgi:predicted Zn-dependent protease
MARWPCNAASCSRARSRSPLPRRAVGAASLGAELIGQRYSREAELESDRYGMRYMAAAGYDPRAAISLQETFLRLSEGRSNQGWVAGLFASHPPSAERVAQNRATAASLPAGGTIGRDPYQAATADLRRAEPAYTAYDAGRAALQAGDTAQARRLADEAIRLVNDEGHFYALLGDIELQQRRPADAIADYDRAIARNRNFFYYYLAKGMAHQQLNQSTEAQAAYVASISLLPTADAYYGLGQLAERRGDTPAAIAQYRRAAESSGAAGEAAGAAVVRLDLPANPGQYLGLETRLDADGRLVLRIANPTQFAVTDLSFVVSYTDAAGRAQETSRELGRTLEAGRSIDVATGLGPFSSSQSYAVRFGAAQTQNP